MRSLQVEAQNGFSKEEKKKKGLIIQLSRQQRETPLEAKLMWAGSVRRVHESLSLGKKVLVELEGARTSPRKNSARTLPDQIIFTFGFGASVLIAVLKSERYVLE